VNFVTSISLNGIWKATDDLGVQAKAGRIGYDSQGWRDLPVPGHWQETPGLERFSSRLLYRTSFDWTEPLSKEVFARLRFDGIFYAAKVWVNGHFLGESEGYFLPTSYDVSKVLRTGENVIMVEVASPAESEPNGKRQLTGIFAHWQGKPDAVEPGGIWGDVNLELFHGVVPERLIVKTVVDRLASGDDPTTAHLTFELGLHGVADGRMSWTATITPETFVGDRIELSGSQAVRRGLNRLQSSVLLNDPHLWWTWDHGQPDLYRFTLEIAVDDGPVQRHERLFGICQVELRGAQTYLNGRRVFLRGTSYPGPDIRIARATQADYRRDMEMIRQANVNLTRVLGHVGKPALYEEASRQGILLWQDLPLQGLYSRTILDEAKRQATGMVEMLGHWPAIGFWCAHAGPVRRPGKDEGFLERSLVVLDRIAGNWNLSSLAPAVKQRIQSADPHRPCLAHPMDWGGLLGATDTRVHIGWAQGRAEDLVRFFKLFPDKAKFPTEFGADSFPSLPNSRRFVRGSWPDLNWDELTDAHMLQRRLLDRHVRPQAGRSLEGYVEATQAYQADLIKRIVEHLRRLKYGPCGGMLQPFFCDVAPGVTSSIVDYWRSPKSAYAAVRDAYNPTLIMVDWPQMGYPAGGRLSLQVYLINDLYQNFGGQWRWSISRRGERLCGESQPAYLPPDRVIAPKEGLAWQIPSELPPGPAELILELELEGREPIQNRYQLQIIAGRS